MAMLETMAYKFGFRGADAIEKYTAEAWKFSLLESGLLGKETCRLLIINGMEDTLWPIEDCILVAMSGTNINLLGPEFVSKTRGFYDRESRRRR